ncbi:MAG TPA: TIGR02147 family protein [Fibrobacteria bacterium]|nr:TIGR02147 family protein [Fibrobacteria bacterium]HOX49985.1 TIGR02147 family protein [Fibrobacteria bacterium]
MTPRNEGTISTRKEANPRLPVTVFDYLDYRAYLRDLYHIRKAQDARFSCRYIAQKVGFRSASYFTHVISGRSTMSSEMALRFAAFLRLDPREADYLELLVLHEKAKSLKERRRILERLSTFREAMAVRVPPEHFEFYRCWHHTAIRELLFLEPFAGDHAALGKRLRPAISAAKAKASIDLLLKLGMAREENGKVVRAHGHSTTTGEAVQAVEVDGFHDSTLQLARDSIDGMPRGDRALSSLTVTLSREGRARVESEIVEFRRRILAIAEADSREIGVYHLGIQLFPMTREATP